MTSDSIQGPTLGGSLVVGATGFVGSNLVGQLRRAGMPPAAAISSSEWHELRSRPHFHTVIVAAPHARKWWAAIHPEDDRRICEALANELLAVDCERLVLLSTIDATGLTTGFDEDSAPDEPANPYGMNRLWLERRLQSARAGVSVIRLPGLFGEGLKKNVLFDILNGRDVSGVHPDDQYQWYSIDWLLRDIALVLGIGADRAFLTSQPIAVREVILACLPSTAHSLAHPGADLERGPISYGLTSKFASLWPTSTNGFQYDKRAVLGALRLFMAPERPSESDRVDIHD